MTSRTVHLKVSVKDHLEDLDPEAVKNEDLEDSDEQRVYERLTPADDSPMSTENNFPIVKLSDATASSNPSLSSLLGKRKRKPKVRTDELSLIPIMMKNKKKISSSKSSHAIPVHVTKSMSFKQEKVASDLLRSPIRVKSPTLIRAEQVQSSLGPETPSFVKLLVRSHVGSCFWMGLPVSFCKAHLPRKDTVMILENETGEQFEIKYIAEKTGLSAGWRKFAAAHKLLEGDFLTFQLVETNKFKVYVIRANDLTEVDGALSLLNLDAHTKQNEAENAEWSATAAREKRRRKHQKSLPLAVVQEIVLRRPDSEQPVEQSGNDSEEVGSEVLGGSRFCDGVVQFEDIKSFNDFHITVSGQCIDSELTEHTRREYYELCCSKNAFLHDCLLPDLHCTLVAGIIFEMVNIVDAMRACKLTTSQDEFARWDKSLKSFELLGMNVGFLRSRLHRLQTLAFNSDIGSETKRYLEAKAEQTRVQNETRNLEAKLVELREVSEKLEADVEDLKWRAEKHIIKFQGEVDASW